MTASLADVPIGTPVYGIGFVDAVRRYLRGYVVFTGRASRSEYWWGQLAAQAYALVVSMLAAVVYVVVLVAAVASAPPSSSSSSAVDGLMAGATLVFYGALFVLLAPVLLPTYSSGARRLRDAGFSPWLVLLGLVPLGGYVVIVLMILPTKPDPSWVAWQRSTYGYGQQAALPGGYVQPGRYGQPGGYVHDPYAQPPSHQAPADDRGQP